MLTNIKIGDLFQLRNGQLVRYEGNHYCYNGIDSFELWFEGERMLSDWFITGQYCASLCEPDSSIISEYDIVKKFV